MFRRHPLEVEDLVRQVLRVNGLETPLLQRRAMNAWDEVAGTVASQYTVDKQIRNMTLWVKIENPAVRADLQMRCTEIVSKINAKVGTQIISNIRIF